METKQYDITEIDKVNFPCKAYFQDRNTEKRKIKFGIGIYEYQSQNDLEHLVNELHQFISEFPSLKLTSDDFYIVVNEFSKDEYIKHVIGRGLMRNPDNNGTEKYIPATEEYIVNCFDKLTTPNN